jgi:succinoglycan biosynthesis transport protein ExoP
LGENSHSQTQASSSSLGELNLGAYLEIARRRKLWIILTTLGVFCAITIYARRLPDIYSAETVILVDSAQVPDKYVPTLSTGDIAGRLTTLQQQVLSPTRVKKLVEAEGLYPDPTGKRTEAEIVHSVQKSITVELVNQGAGKMSAFRIQYSSRKREIVARMANKLAQMFIEENVRVRVDQTQDTTQFLQDQLQETKRQLDEKDALLRGIKAHNIQEMPESKPYHLESLANLRTQVQGIQDKVQQDQRDKSMLQSMMNSGMGAPTVDVDNPGAVAGGGGGYQAEIEKLSVKLSQLKARYGPNHPDIRKTQNELDQLKAKAALEGQSAAADTDPAATTGATGPKPKRRNPVLEAQIEKLDEEIQQQTKLLQPLQSRIDYHEGKLQQIPVFEQQIGRLQQDYDILKLQYTQLLEKEKAAEISHALEVRQKGEKFEILDTAVTPEHPASPNRQLFSMAGLFGGLVAGIVLAAIAETNDESVRTENEAARIFGKPVLAGVPRIVSAQERRARHLRTSGLVLGTVAGSCVLGFLLSYVSGRLF